MLKCPNCHKIMEDGAKFCSECASSLVPLEENENALPKEALVEEIVAEMEESEVTEVIVETEESEETAEPEKEPVKKHSRKGVFVSMLLAILAVVAMYIFYEDLGFGTSQKGSNDVVLYLKDGELYYNDLSGSGEIQITKDLAGALSVTEMSLISVKLSDDGKTVFYPDRAGAGTDGYSLYCTKPGSDELPVKLGNDITWYDIDGAGSVVYYITTEKIMYRHDLQSKTKIAVGVETLTVSDNGKKAVYRTEDGGLYLIEDNTAAKKIASRASAYYVSGSMDCLYYTAADGLWRFDFADSYKIGSDKAEVLNYRDCNLVFIDDGVCYLVTNVGKYELDCEKSASDFLFSVSGEVLFYCESVGEDTNINDVYRVQIKDGKPGAAVLCDSDASGCFLVNDTTIGCFKDVKEHVGDLYINGKCYGYDVNLYSLVRDGSKAVAFLADCAADGSGTLTVFDGKDTFTVRSDVSGCSYTAKGELVFLCDMGKSNGKGDLYRIVGNEAKPVTDGVSMLVQPIKLK